MSCEKILSYCHNIYIYGQSAIHIKYFLSQLMQDDLFGRRDTVALSRNSKFSAVIPVTSEINDRFPVTN